jgi:hypothetical protein
MQAGIEKSKIKNQSAFVRDFGGQECKIAE